MRKLTLIILLLAVLTVTACSFEMYAPKHDIHTSYKEWAKQIGLYSTENVLVSCYDDEKKIKVGLDRDGGMLAYEEMCAVIEAHNKFVEDNPGYFSEDMQISFFNESRGCTPWISFFFNDTDNASFDYIKELQRQSTAKIQYMCIDLNRATIEMKVSDSIEMDIPVIILMYDNQETPGEAGYAFLTEFKKAEQIIVDYIVPNYDKNEVAGIIHKYLPNVEIYFVGPEGLEKYEK
ncbi:hypothetical protein [Butyrivibrio hungatei]|uniref:Lipoprotein n=1 Tax=Butyrivibrio hungatei TaxID=185008 RepID=A0A1D9P3W3_9FIRM|nr:hypothetical protein [Butyrivibrio hungatei]AOZ97288.1 hypothetical protein bhn_I2255 [Butyrivibrio hungatei]